jgi:hypothetical protein
MLAPRGKEQTSNSERTVMSDLAYYFKQVHLSRLSDRLEPMLKQATIENWSYETFLTTFLETEVFARDQNLN